MLASTSHSSTSSHGQLAILRQAAQDDHFRAALAADPEAVLARYGLQVDPDQIPSRITLPSKEAIQGCLGDLGEDSDDPVNMNWTGLILG